MISHSDSFAGLFLVLCTVLVIMMCFYLFQKVSFLVFIFCTSKTHTLAILSLDGDLAFLLLYMLLKIHAMAILFLDCELVSLTMHSFENTYSCCYFTGSELAWFLIYTVLVTQSVTCFVSGGELVWISMCTLQLTWTWPVLF